MKHRVGTFINYYLNDCEKDKNGAYEVYTKFLTLTQLVEEIEDQKHIKIQFINDRVLRICEDNEVFFAEILRIDYTHPGISVFVADVKEIANKYYVISLFETDNVMIIDKNGNRPSDVELAKLRMLGIIKSRVI